jgi:hypothetical protein
MEYYSFEINFFFYNHLWHARPFFFFHPKPFFFSVVTSLATEVREFIYFLFFINRYIVTSLLFSQVFVYSRWSWAFQKFIWFESSVRCTVPLSRMYTHTHQSLFVKLFLPYLGNTSNMWGNLMDLEGAKVQMFWSSFKVQT